ncbi:MAG: DUF3019 domain-containing protein [Moraxellaceae bacterium]|nr:MAG: DUF3019 domain-containing protein [Moraxellaceae bacterium]
MYKIKRLYRIKHLYKIKDLETMQAWIKYYSGILTLVIGSLLYPVYAHADDAKLSIKPSRCIALHEGQVCYQSLKINWRTSVTDNYCLYSQKNNTPIMCWDNLSQGVGNYEFESSDTQKFTLARKGTAQVLAEYTVEVAWVYDARSRRESHWRIF